MRVDWAQNLLKVLNRSNLFFSGSEEGALAGLELEVTLRSMESKRRASMGRRTWVEAGTVEAEGDCLEEEVHLEEEVRV